MFTEAKTKLPFEQVNGQQLKPEQRSYLEGLFAGLADRGLRFGDVLSPAPPPAEPPAADEPRIFEERVKKELHPLDTYPLLLEHAASNKSPERENTFRFKWHGLFHLAPKEDGFMARLRVPAGQVTTFQLRGIANIANELTTGYVQITTRANFQIRLIQPKDAPEVLRRIQSIGLHTRGAGADNIRNLTANPTAGLDPYELIDVSPYCHQMAQIILNDRAFYDLPRKFNIAFDGGGLIGSVEDTNDIGISAVKVPAEIGSIKPGIYFRIKVGGATGHKAFAHDLGVLVPPEEILKVTSALVRVYIKNGNRTDRKRARLKHLLDTWSIEEYLTATEKLLGSTLLRLPAPEPGQPVFVTHLGRGEFAHSHVGVFPQKQTGLNYVGVAVPVGQITPRQLLRLADLADHYGSSELRLTVWQNLIIPNIPDGFVETVKRALVSMGLHWQQSNLLSGLIACTGNAYCKYAASDTKGHALELGRYLDKRIHLDQPINIHLTGCPHSCAQHYMGDIGLLGATVKVAGESVEGYHVFVGGGFGANQAVGRQIFQGLSFDQLKPTVEKMLLGYLRHRQNAESFQNFSARHDLNTLQAIFSNAE